MSDAVVDAGAQVDRTAVLGSGVIVERGAVVEAGVHVGNGTTVGTGAVLRKGVRVGEGCRIFPYAIIGEEPQDLKYTGGFGLVEIGDGSVIREFATIHRPTNEDGVTRVGKQCYLMATSHLGHNVVIGDEVILVNGAALGGHVTVGDQAFISAFAAVHQHCRIGRNVMVGGLCKVTQDVPPFITIDGNPARPFGLNVVGLKRRGFTPEQRVRIKSAYHLLYQASLNVLQATEAMKEQFPGDPIVGEFIDFVAASSRGIVK